jgi:hypothetical protein
MHRFKFVLVVGLISCLPGATASTAAAGGRTHTPPPPPTCAQRINVLAQSLSAADKIIAKTKNAKAKALLVKARSLLAARLDAVEAECAPTPPPSVPPPGTPVSTAGALVPLTFYLDADNIAHAAVVNNTSEFCYTVHVGDNLFTVAPGVQQTVTLAPVQFQVAGGGVLVPANGHSEAFNATLADGTCRS